ncbi:hypothetical protein PHMEG_0009121 [Phytophthora megakarya]|uniref:Uncharacterized protein n=1 Tax=Phytophthora megakarya TaxID=4795 RepID=A0A225WHW2_9STRA|nr:hypothetical protein PHMEG_0009121 [Phytophthora megakarya]
MRAPEGLIRRVDGRHKAYADFVQTDNQETMAMTRNQSKTQKKHVRFADEQQKLPKNRPGQTQSGAQQRELNADDIIDPIVVQPEGRRRIATAQNEELKRCNLKKVLRGEADKLKHRAALDAWKISDRFILTDDNPTEANTRSRRIKIVTGCAHDNDPRSSTE